MSLGNTQGFEQNRGSGLGRLSRGFASGQAGTVYLLGAFALPVMLGMAGLGFDATLWLMDKRENQSVADHSALAAAMTYTRNNDDLTKATDVAKAEALRNGFAHGVDGDVQVAVLANCGPNNTAANCIEVIVSQPSTPLLAGIVFDGPVTIESRAVTALRPRGDACILALDTQMAGALEFGGSSNSAVNCGVASNSAHAQSIVVSGNADLSAEPAVAVGGIEEQGSGSLTTDYPPIPYSQPLDDPYASLAVPTYTSCDETALVVNDTRTMSPGTYCDGLTFGEGAEAEEPCEAERRAPERLRHRDRGASDGAAPGVEVRGWDPKKKQ